MSRTCSLGFVAILAFAFIGLSAKDVRANGFFDVGVGFRAGDVNVGFSAGEIFGGRRHYGGAYWPYPPRYEYYYPAPIIVERPPVYMEPGPVVVERRPIIVLDRRREEIQRALVDLRYGDSDDREDAAKKLGKLRAVEGVNPLIRALLHDRDEDVRKKSAEALGKIGDPRAIEALEDAAQYDREDDVRKEARKALKKIY